ncbi:helix-turn-helix domain-containing protein [Myxococcus sp. CA039A]|uniref:helix-turn-helix domain-containing protein n=1 Tax=Myxococcus sp. CA039A TaxID=2741737 RepID=UPI00157B24B9|nr:helix-turn-helix transcriptional regulator [Myxococcus sp. CA039A]NTX54613.1 helix-turn-helix transcriptional regulator [Myxococcus sp. CA039A]
MDGHQEYYSIRGGFSRQRDEFRKSRRAALSEVELQQAHIEEKQVFGMVLGQVIARLRDQRGFTQGQLAVHLGISQPVMSRIEAGKVQPDAYLFGQLAAALGTTVPALTAHVQEAMTRTARAAEAATATTAQTPAHAWNHAVAVAGVIGLIGIIGFAVAAALSTDNEPPKPSGPKAQ